MLIIWNVFSYAVRKLSIRHCVIYTYFFEYEKYSVLLMQLIGNVWRRLAWAI